MAINEPVVFLLSPLSFTRNDNLNFTLHIKELTT